MSPFSTAVTTCNLKSSEQSRCGRLIGVLFDLVIISPECGNTFQDGTVHTKKAVRFLEQLFILRI